MSSQEAGFRQNENQTPAQIYHASQKKENFDLAIIKKPIFDDATNVIISDFEHNLKKYNENVSSLQDILIKINPVAPKEEIHQLIKQYNSKVEYLSKSATEIHEKKEEISKKYAFIAKEVFPVLFKGRIEDVESKKEYFQYISSIIEKYPSAVKKINEAKHLLEKCFDHGEHGLQYESAFIFGSFGKNQKPTKSSDIDITVLFKKEALEDSNFNEYIVQTLERIRNNLNKDGEFEVKFWPEYSYTFTPEHKSEYVCEIPEKLFKIYERNWNLQNEIDNSIIRLKSELSQGRLSRADFDEFVRKKQNEKAELNKKLGGRAWDIDELDSWMGQANQFNLHYKIKTAQVLSGKNVFNYTDVVDGKEVKRELKITDIPEIETYELFIIATRGLISAASKNDDYSLAKAIINGGYAQYLMEMPSANLYTSYDEKANAVELYLARQGRESHKKLVYEAKLIRAGEKDEFDTPDLYKEIVYFFNAGANKGRQVVVKNKYQDSERVNKFIKKTAKRVFQNMNRLVGDKKNLLALYNQEFINAISKLDTKDIDEYKPLINDIRKNIASPIFDRVDNHIINGYIAAYCDNNPHAAIKYFGEAISELSFLTAERKYKNELFLFSEKEMKLSEVLKELAKAQIKLGSKIDAEKTLMSAISNNIVDSESYRLLGTCSGKRIYSVIAKSIDSGNYDALDESMNPENRKISDTFIRALKSKLNSEITRSQENLNYDLENVIKDLGTREKPVKGASKKITEKQKETLNISRAKLESAINCGNNLQKFLGCNCDLSNLIDLYFEYRKDRDVLIIEALEEHKKYKDLDSEHQSYKLQIDKLHVSLREELNLAIQNSSSSDLKNTIGKVLVEVNNLIQDGFNDRAMEFLGLVWDRQPSILSKNRIECTYKIINENEELKNKVSAITQKLGFRTEWAKRKR